MTRFPEQASNLAILGGVTMPARRVRMRLRGQVVIITGASSGIGAALARELARAGCRLGLVARRTERLEALAADLKHEGVTVAWATADVGDREQLRQAITQLASELGPPDIVIANAALGDITPLDHLHVPQTEAMFRVNVFGVIYTFEAVLADMLQRGRGHLIAISSVAGFKGVPGAAAYSSTKAAVNAYVEALRIQFRGRGVSFTTVCPGFVRTEMTAGHRHPMPWLMDAERAASIIRRGIERKAAWVVFPWQMALFIWSARWAPDWLTARMVPRVFLDQETVIARDK
jgi:short-subunit dehydrogenase